MRSLTTHRHVANANPFLFAGLRREIARDRDYEKTADKAAPVKALNDSLAFCDAADAERPTRTSTKIKTPAPGGPRTRHSAAASLIFNTAHNNEHYGNIIVT